MSKSGLLLLSISLALFGIAIIAGHPPWGAVTGTAILLTAAGLAAGGLTANLPAEDYAEEPRPAGQKVSNSLVALSGAAVLAVYVAGYHRTGSAAERFAAQTSRRPAVAAVIIPAPTPALIAPAASPRAAAPARRTPRAARPARAASPAPPSPEPPAASPSPVPATSEAAAPAAPEPAKPEVIYKDGTYLGWGSCRHGDLQVSVVIENGRIASTSIVQCLTRYPCSWIANLPKQAVIRQSPNVDFVSGATQSTEAFSDAVSSALAQAHE